MSVDMQTRNNIFHPGLKHLCHNALKACTDKLDVYRESGGKLTLEKDRFYILATKVCAAVALRLGQPAVIN